MVHREDPCMKNLATTAAIKISHRGFRRFAPTSPPACGGLCQKKTKSSGVYSCCFLFSFCGERGIRTPGTGKSVRQFSKLLVSATHPSHQTGQKRAVKNPPLQASHRFSRLLSALQPHLFQPLCLLQAKSPPHFHRRWMPCHAGKAM